MDTTTFSALAEPTRLRMVEILKEGPLSVGDIAERLELRRLRPRSICAYCWKPDWLR